MRSKLADESFFPQSNTETNNFQGKGYRTKILILNHIVDIHDELTRPSRYLTAYFTNSWKDMISKFLRNMDTGKKISYTIWKKTS